MICKINIIAGDLSDEQVRDLHESFENVPRLPVYLRSAGYKKLESGTLESSPELHSPFFEIIWCKRGVGEVFLYNEAFSLLANDIFFYR